MPGAVWVQAVSVGEMLVALKLIAALRDQSPELPIILSTTTTTGHAVAEERVPGNVEVVYTPVDLPGAVRRAFDGFRPAQMVIVDGGLWPNQLWEARRRGVPTALVNARLSPRSERRYRRFPRLARALFGSLDLVCVAEKNEVERWQNLGISLACLRPTGSIKFDDALLVSTAVDHPTGEAARQQRARRELLASFGVGADTPILLAGSTHPGEERAIGEVYLKLRARFPNLFFIVAPRHVERARQVHTELASLGLSVALRTPISTVPPAANPNTLLLNTTGELKEWFSVATVVFIGKSLCAVGGQNPAEAIAAGIPVVFGPHMENFEELTARLLAADAAVQVSTPLELEARCGQLFADKSERARLAKAARNEIMVHRGAAVRTATLLLAQKRNSACEAI